MVYCLWSMVYCLWSTVSGQPPTADARPWTADHRPCFLACRKLACVVSRTKSGAIKNKIMVHGPWSIVHGLLSMVYCPWSAVGRQRSAVSGQRSTADRTPSIIPQSFRGVRYRCFISLNANR
jgi:hypothetical protein